jgi:hypothetical protein
MSWADVLAWFVNKATLFVNEPTHELNETLHFSMKNYIHIIYAWIGEHFICMCGAYELYLCVKVVYTTMLMASVDEHMCKLWIYDELMSDELC